MAVLARFLTALVLAAAVLGGRAASGADVTDPEAIGPGDVLTIAIGGEPELSGDLTVDASGRIVMQLIGAVDVDGLGRVDAEHRIKAALADGFLINPRVSITVWHSHAQPGFVAGEPVADVELVVASGTLEGQFLASGLFHLGEFWIQADGDTAFSRWLSEGIGRTVVVSLMSDRPRPADARGVRVLSGTLVHQTAPSPTPAAVDAVGRHSEGDLLSVHVLFLRDELTRTFGPVTFETADFATVAIFAVYDNTPVNIVIEIR